MLNNPDALRILDNARRLRKDALHTCVALDLVAPVPHHTWIPVCSWCVDAVAEEAHRINADDGRDTGCCSACGHGGRDTLVALVQEAVIS